VSDPIYFDNLGYVALGIFVGTVTSMAVNYVKDMQTSEKAITVVIPAALGGTAMTFLQLWDKAKHGMPAYAIGLLLGLLWVRVEVAVTNITQPQRGNPPDRAPYDRTLGVIGFLHLLSVICISFYFAALLLPEAFFVRFQATEQ